jgi:thymidylate synthase (FAD)
MKDFDVSLMFATIDVLDHGSVELFDAMLLDPKLKVANAARVSYKKESIEFSEKDAKLVKFLYEHGHFSTFRHSYFSFRIKAPLFVFRQWWKYQVGSNWEEENEDIGCPVIIPDTSWNESSGRYVEFDPHFYVPDLVREQSKVNKQGSSQQEIAEIDGKLTKQIIEDGSKQAFETYNKLVKAGVAKEIARIMLPQNIYSECIWTCSLQTLIHFFGQRLKNDAQYEIREFAWAIHSLLRDHLGEMIDVGKGKEDYDWFNEKLNEDK